MAGAGKRLEREQNDRITLAWMTAALSRAHRIPKLETLIAGNGGRRKQTWQEQLATVKMINAAFGGT